MSVESESKLYYFRASQKSTLMKNKSKQFIEIGNELVVLKERVEKSAKEGKNITDAELMIFDGLLKIGGKLLLHHIELVKENTTKSFIEENKKKLFQNKGLVMRTYYSIFGKISFTRNKYYEKGKKQIFYPVDKALQLPKGLYSYVLQDWIGFDATEKDYRSSVELINRILKQNISGMQAERISNELSEEVENFYEESANILTTERCYFAAGFDDKGIPILPSEVNRAVDSSGVRLGKGQKNGVKKIAQ